MREENDWQRMLKEVADRRRSKIGTDDTNIIS